MVCWLALAGVAPAQTQEASESQIKAAFLFNFGKFVEWPATAFAAPKAPLVIGVYGADALDGELARVVKDKTINGHPLVMQVIAPADDFKTPCHILFISAAQARETRRLRAILSQAAAAGVLTVGELPSFKAAGGMISFFDANGRINFEINERVARQAGLKISYKLLMLAKDNHNN
jgi:hypothetical protein